jgi:carboxyl-terminal processing protease
VHKPITLTINRKRRAPFTVRIVRRVIRIKSVSYKAEGDVGYIHISSFSERTPVELIKAVVSLKKQIGPKLAGYVLDLRDDPGGLLGAAIAVSDDFLERGAIVTTRGRATDASERANATPGDITDGKKLVVLINGGSASASEIVAGALQDHRRATLVGTRSFGKGSVQTIIPLDGGGALRLTTARYYTPSGRSIQAEGIEPDAVIEEPTPKSANNKSGFTDGEASLRGHLRLPETRLKKKTAALPMCRLPKARTLSLATLSSCCAIRQTVLLLSPTGSARSQERNLIGIRVETLSTAPEVPRR